MLTKILSFALSPQTRAQQEPQPRAQEEQEPRAGQESQPGEATEPQQEQGPGIPGRPGRRPGPPPPAAAADAVRAAALRNLQGQGALSALSNRTPPSRCACSRFALLCGFIFCEERGSGHHSFCQDSAQQSHARSDSASAVKDHSLVEQLARPSLLLLCRFPARWTLAAS